MVVSPEEWAAEAGIQILKSGGNAFDAAVAVGFALAVTYPSAGNIGGGGFLVGLKADGTAVAIDFREVAPAASNKDMFLDENGEMIDGLSTKTHKAVGVPGSVDGLLKAAELHGRLDRKKILAPAIALARDGFEVSYSFAKSLERGFSEKGKLGRFESTKTAFMIDGRPPRMGEILRQPDLAKTLRLIAKKGRDGFYTGRVAELIAADMKRRGGLITKEGLANYRSIERAPFIFHHGDFELITHPVPSSGGTTIAQILGLLDVQAMDDAGFHSAHAIHLVTEAQRLAFADRNYWMGDPAFYDVPVEVITSEAYLDERRKLLPRDGHAGDSAGVRHGAIESEETTHYCVADRWGNVVAVTTTLNSGYGMGAVAEGAGFLWNNQMDNFSAKPGAPNQYGMIGAEANSIEPGKRMLSSMTPTIVRRDGEFYMTMGSPGGPTIINTVLQIYLNVTVYGMNIESAIDAGRIHHQWTPDRIDHEAFAISPDTMTELEKKGYKLRRRGNMGMAAGILALEDGTLSGHADRRGSGVALGY